MMGAQSEIYRALRIWNDAKAARRGRLGRRLIRRLVGKAVGRGIMRRI